MASGEGAKNEFVARTEKLRFSLKKICVLCILLGDAQNTDFF